MTVAADALDQLVIVPNRLVDEIVRREEVAAAYEPLLHSQLADDECQHGRLPGDRTPACGCWPIETREPEETVA